MQQLPLVLSVPHAGMLVPSEVIELCQLSGKEIEADSDGGAAEIYALQDHVPCFVTTPVARAIVDLNRARDDFRVDGVIKTRTCWDIPIYRRSLTRDEIEHLLVTYYDPYHRELEERFTPEVRLGVDCHTMAGSGPPHGPDSGQKRPAVCLGNNLGRSMPSEWTVDLQRCLSESMQEVVTINQPFSGGYITRRHGGPRPWVQLELNRDLPYSYSVQRERVLAGLTEFCQRRGW